MVLLCRGKTSQKRSQCWHWINATNEHILCNGFLFDGTRCFQCLLSRMLYFFFILFYIFFRIHNNIFFFLGMPNKPQPSVRHNYDVCHLYSLLCQTLSIQTPRCNSQCLFNSVRSWCFGSYWSPGSLLVFVDCVWAFPVLLCGHDYFHCFWCLLSWHR